MVFTTGYNLTIEVSAAPPVFHRTPNPVTLTCRAAVNGTLGSGISMEIRWSKEDVPLTGTPQDVASEATLEHETSPNATQVQYFKSMLTMPVLKPSNNGTYTCTAMVVKSSTRLPLSAPVSSSMDMHVVGECDIVLGKVDLLAPIMYIAMVTEAAVVSVIWVYGKQPLWYISGTKTQNCHLVGLKE